MKVKHDKNCTFSGAATPSRYHSGCMAIFGDIKKYHEELGYPRKTETLTGTITQHRELCLALHGEVSELMEAVPWKPWRPESYRGIDRANLIEECVDIIFFVGSVLETWDVSPAEVAQTLEDKMTENRRRIQEGYNRNKENM